MPRIDSKLSLSPSQASKGAGVPKASVAGAPASAPAMASDVAQLSAPAAPPASATTADTTGLNDEEKSLLADGLLPTTYAKLKAVAAEQGVDAAKAMHQAGKKGPFSPDYGDPAQMLSGARRIRKNPEIFKMAQETKKGDIIIVAFNSNTDLIANATNGPFAHALVCSEDGPPPDFIEAMGVTGDQNDPSCNRVRRTSFGENFGNGSSFRRIRPAESLPESERAAAIDKAVDYAAKQLGKPYDYTFGETEVGKAFYCSSLAYYSYVKGAGLQVPIDKAAPRDTLMLALDSVVDRMEPKDRDAFMDEAARTLNANPKPGEEELVKFVVERILPNCKGTEKIFDDPGDKARLQAVIEKFRKGQGMPRYDAASKAFRAAEKSGRYQTPVLGFFRKQWDRLKSGVAAVRDINHAFDGSGLNKWETFKATRQVLAGLLPYSEALSAFAFGKEDGRTKTFGKILDTTGYLRSHKPFSWVFPKIPVRQTNAIDHNFISPTDLAWAKLNHWDYNVKADRPLDRK